MTENYQVLARKYRPQTFQEVVGQDAAVTILKNSIRASRLAQAYLFSGSRGIGKTTLARLLAKAINCQNLPENLEPCNKCPSCLEIAAGCSLDVLEIDGASNRGIDDIRQINETIGYAPSSGKYKIYIIDEVHMLTKEAFNALLKTLEEPPASIKFFFATTEPHKVPPTILSRCQRFDLLRITYEEIIAKLKKILVDINRSAEDKALHLIARFSDGSLRDSQSLLDQLLCYEDGTITEDVVSKVLGLIPQDYFFNLDQAVQKANEAFAFEIAETIYALGKDFTHFVQELIEHFRRYLILKHQTGSLELSPEIQQTYTDNLNLYTKEELSYILEQLLQALPALQKSLSKKTAVEMLLLQIIRLKKRVALPVLVQRLMELEKKASAFSDQIEAKPLTEAQTISNAAPFFELPVEKVNTSTNPEPIKETHQTAPNKEELKQIIDDLPLPVQQTEKKEIDTPTQTLTAAPFDLTIAKTKTEPLPIKPLPEIKPQNGSTQEPIKKQDRGRLDTLLHFTAVELGGTVRKE